jgi:hypothetical protein
MTATDAARTRFTVLPAVYLILVRGDETLLARRYRTRFGDGEYALVSDLFFVATAWQGEPAIREPDKGDDLRWFPLAALPANTMRYVRLALERWRAGVVFSTYGWDAGE